MDETLKNNFAVAAIASGGELLRLAEEKKIPYIRIPDTGIQPRQALGFSLLAVLKFTREAGTIAELKKLSKILKPADWEVAGKELAERIKGHVPVIYASSAYLELAYVWKIKFNETGKIPAFCNRFPELNHNEMTGFSAADESSSGGDVSKAAQLSEKFYFLILRDEDDHPRILKRMEILKKLYEERGLKVEMLDMQGAGTAEEIFTSVMLADWAAYHTAMQYGLDPKNVPMVEDFKKAMDD